jgi:hypothetical protein
MSTGTKKPSTEAQAPQTYLQVEAGIYRYKDKEGKITYHERPFIMVGITNGKLDTCHLRVNAELWTTFARSLPKTRRASGQRSFTGRGGDWRKNRLRRHMNCANIR